MASRREQMETAIASSENAVTHNTVKTVDTASGVTTRGKRAALEDIGNVQPAKKRGRIDAKESTKPNILRSIATAKRKRTDKPAVEETRGLLEESMESKEEEPLEKQEVAKEKSVPEETMVVQVSKEEDDKDSEQTETRRESPAEEIVEETIDCGEGLGEPFDLAVGVMDIDEMDRGNPQMVAEYASEIYKYLDELQEKHRLSSGYMNAQPDINEKMRSVLVDWLVDVHRKFKLMQETLYLSVSLIDRVLSVMPVARSRLQLIGVTAILLASKYEEIYNVAICDLSYITDHTYNCDEIRAMEEKMLHTLNFDFAPPLPVHFLRRYSKAAGASSVTHTVAKFVMELTLLSVDMLDFLPSEIGASALWIALQLLRLELWDPTECEEAIYATSSHERSLGWPPHMQHYSQCLTAQRIFPCAGAMLRLLNKVYLPIAPTPSGAPGRLPCWKRAILTKYNKPAYFCVAQVCSPAAPLLASLNAHSDNISLCKALLQSPPF